MIKIAIICLLISMIRSERCSFSSEEMNQLKNHYEKAEKKMEEATQSQSENAAIILGYRRSGKSTLINYLLENNNLQEQETTIPLKISSTRQELMNLDIWDTAEFSDNENKMQILINSFHLYHLTKKVENLKFILAINFSDIKYDYPENMINLLNILDEYLNGCYKDIFPSISIIITEAPLEVNRFTVNSDYIKYKLDRNLLSNSYISDDSKSLIQDIMSNINRVAFLRQSQSDQNPSPNTNDDIIQAIKTCKSVTKSSHQNISFPISAQLKNCLQNTNEELMPMSQLLELGEKIFDMFKENNNSFCQTNDTSTLNENKAKLENIYKSINASSTDNSDALAKLELLKKSHDTIKTFIEEKSLESKISHTKFIDSILKYGKFERICIMLDSIINETDQRISKLISICSEKLNKTNN
ncbi:uncharacterized protein LOC122501995 [Leptopilina heterotoma]|uniref:uncharacterized protein LOC122501995 n=1 Tax=Leptopilina heterotoma TaxID=63436 RepID=UPI001CA93A25|nr:uncharacterized protein LOC122501995 [Leptopilina heterotoma]